MVKSETARDRLIEDLRDLTAGAVVAGLAGERYVLDAGDDADAGVEVHPAGLLDDLDHLEQAGAARDHVLGDDDLLARL